VRVLACSLAAFAAGAAVAWFSGPGSASSRSPGNPGRDGASSGPTRKETTQTTGIVFAFVVVMALFLWVVDKGLEWVLYDLILGWKKIDDKRWYVVHAYSGMEKSVAGALQERIERAGMQDKFGKILVPTEEVVEMKNGQKHDHRAPVLPRLRARRDGDDRRHLAPGEEHPKVTGFVGGTANRPTPISEKEVDKIMAADAGGRRKAQAQGAVRGRRDGARQGRPVHRLQRQRRGSQLREEPCACR
jgi:preprotein translocase SecE subunit